MKTRGSVRTMARNLFWMLVVALAMGTALTVAGLEAFGFTAGGLLGLVQLFLTPLTGFVLALRGASKRRARMSCAGMGLLLAAFASLVASALVQSGKDAASQTTGDAVCAALDSFHRQTGRYPDQLRELVPVWLMAVPATSQGVFSTVSFDYRSDAEDGTYRLGFPSSCFMYCSRGPDTSWRCGD
jgi:hypothetical protein